MSIPRAADPPDRRRAERRTDPRITDLTIPELRRMLVTTLLFTVVLVLFLWMVRTVVIAAILAVVVAVYLRPLYLSVLGRVGHPAPAATIALSALVIPILAAAVYSYIEVRGVVAYLQTHHTEVVARIDAQVQRLLPFLDLENASERIGVWVQNATDYGAAIPEVVQETIVTISVSVAIFLFTAFYVLTDSERIVGWLRSKVPPRYEELSTALTSNVRSVLYGTVYSTLITQSLKGGVILVLNLALGVPLAVVLAILAFVIGFFPIVGSWSVYLPTSAWLLIFGGSGTKAALMLVICFTVNTLLISLYLRPKIAAERSRVLNFYWMLVGLVTGVYTFGLAGIVLGPILIGLLKAVIDTVTARSDWRFADPDGGDAAPSGAGG
jgi:predicted PurR-regulated permease PerM